MNAEKRVPAPPGRSRLQAPAPQPRQAPNNLSTPTDGIKDLNFKVSPDFHRRFKMTAATWGMSMRDLLEAAYSAWVEKHGETPPDGDLFKR